MNVCKQCGDEFIYSRKKNNSKYKCRKCYGRDRRKKMEEKICKYVTLQCVKCNYDKCRQALHFHHRDKATKLFNVGGSRERSWENIKKEIDKCDILCANCHIELEHYLGELPFY